MLFTLLGLGILGLFPATSALFTVIRHFLIGDNEKPIFQMFWKAYREGFRQMNVIGLILVVIGSVIVLDLRFFQLSDNFLLQSLSFLFFFLLFIFITVVLYVFPIYVHYHYKTFEYLKFAFIIAIGKPMISIMMFVGSYLLFMLFQYTPILFVFFGGPMIGYVLMWISLKAFPKAAKL